VGITAEAVERFCAYDWPGNVRELENLMERLAILRGEGEIGLEDLPRSIRDRVSEPAFAAPQVPASALPFNEVVDRFETDIIRQALEHTHWNKNRAAQLLGLNRTTLLEKMKKKGLDAPEG